MGIQADISNIPICRKICLSTKMLQAGTGERLAGEDREAGAKMRQFYTERKERCHRSPSHSLVILSLSRVILFAFKYYLVCLCSKTTTWTFLSFPH